MNNIKKLPFILVIVGDSAAGKSTLLANLSKEARLKSWVSVHDMDENGVPVPGREYWRKHRVEQLLHDAVIDYNKGKGAVIGGWIWPHEIIESPYFDPKLNLHFLFLNNTEAEYRRRLKKRIGTRMTQAEFKAWASNFGAQQKKLAKQVASLKDHRTIDTWKFNRSEVTIQALLYIQKITL